MNWAQTLFCVKNIIPNNFSIFTRTNLKTTKKTLFFWLVHGVRTATTTIEMILLFKVRKGQQQIVEQLLSCHDDIITVGETKKKFSPGWRNNLSWCLPECCYHGNAQWLRTTGWTWTPPECLCHLYGNIDRLQKKKQEERKKTSESTYAIILRYSVILPPTPDRVLQLALNVGAVKALVKSVPHVPILHKCI